MSPVLLSVGSEPGAKWTQSSHCDQEKPEAGQLLVAKAVAHPPFLKHRVCTTSCPLKSSQVWLRSTPGVKAGCPVSDRRGCTWKKNHFTGSDRWSSKHSTCPNQHFSHFLSLHGLSSPGGILLTRTVCLHCWLLICSRKCLLASRLARHSSELGAASSG